MGALVKRSLRIGQKRTSVALEMEFWQALEAIALLKNISMPALIATVAASDDKTVLASALRVYALKHAPRMHDH